MSRLSQRPGGKAPGVPSSPRKHFPRPQANSSSPWPGLLIAGGIVALVLLIVLAATSPPPEGDGPARGELVDRPAASASTAGLFASPQGSGPLLAASALAARQPHTKTALPAMVPPSPDKPGKTLGPLPPPPPAYTAVLADWRQPQRLAWETPLGPGGVRVPGFPDLASPASPTEAFTRLEAVVFPADGREVLFVGSVEEGRPLLNAEELFDAFAVLIRSLASCQEAPRMSIDPTPQQAAGGLKGGEPMPVHYFGDIRGTIVGWIALQADLLLKWLGLGEGGDPGQPFVCTVNGYRSRLDMLAARPGAGRSRRWHRFWFEQGPCSVSASPDGRALRVTAQVRARTSAQEARSGQLLDAEAQTDPEARALVAHLTDNYDAYARQLPVLARLQALAQLTAVAEAVLPDAPARRGLKRAPADPGAAEDSPAPRPARPRPQLDLDWLIAGYRARAVNTPATVPARAATRTRPNGSSIGLTGGVTLQPANRYTTGDERAANLQRDVLAQRPAGGRWWWATSGGTRYRVVACGPAAWNGLVVWQTDLTVGRLALTRDYWPAHRRPAPGVGWQPRRPTLFVSDRVVTLRGADGAAGNRVADGVTVLDGPDRIVTLNRAGTTSLPGERPTTAYFSRDGRRQLVCYTNGWFYLDGPVRWQSGDGTRWYPVLGPGARIVEFSPDAGHTVRLVRTPEGVTRYVHDGGRLTRLETVRPDGEATASIALLYDAQNRCAGARSSDGGEVRYLRDARGEIVAAVDRQGRAVCYGYNRLTGLPEAVEGVRARSEVRSGDGGSQANPPRLAEAANFHARPAPDWDAVCRQASELAAADPGTAWVCLRPAPARSGRDYDLAVNGRAVAHEGRLADLFDPLAGDAARLRRLFFDGEAAGRRRVVLAPDAIRGTVVGALRQLDARREVAGTDDLGRAAANLARIPETAGRPRVVIHPEGMRDDVAARLRPREGQTADSSVVIVAGHNDVRLEHFMNRLGANGELRGRVVVIAGCGGNNTPGLSARLRREHGATRVLVFSGMLEQSHLPAFVERAVSRLTAEARTGAANKSGTKAADAEAPLGGAGAADPARVQRVVDEVLDGLRRGAEGLRDLEIYQEVRNPAAKGAARHAA